MKITRIIIIIAFVVICNQILAQNDTIKSEVIYSWKLNPSSLNMQAVDVDTVLDNFQNYNLLLKNKYTLNYLGNLGSSAQQHAYFKRSENKTGFVFSEPYAIYFHNPKNQKYYNTKRQYTELSYTSAGKKNESEQTLGVLHTQNVNEKLNFGIDYDMISSEGRYQNQQIRQNDITLFSSYIGDRYNFHGNFTLNRLKAQENGGIDSLKYLGDDDYKNRRNIPVKLEDVSSQVYSTNLYLVNEFKLGKKIREITVEKKVVKKAQRSTLNLFNGGKVKSNNLDLDSSKIIVPENNDSVYFDTTYVNFVRLNGVSFSHEFSYERHARKFYDEDIDTLDEPFYLNKNIYLDSVSTNDQLFQNLISNKLSIHYRKNTFIDLMLSIYNEQMSYDFSEPFIDTTQSGLDTLVERDIFDQNSSTSISGFLGSNIGKLKLSVYGEYFFEGYKTGNSKANVSIHYQLIANNYIGLDANYKNQNPDYYYKRYSTNHYNWKNDYLRMEENWDVGLNYYNKTLETNIAARYGHISNYFYFDTIAEINQYRDILNIYSLELNQKFKIGPFHSYTNILYQKCSTDSILSLPTYMLYQSLYYQRLFNFASTGGRLLMQFGVDYRYTSKYYADNYMPLSGVFYKQNSYEMDNYHRFDVFLNFNIKRASLYLRYDYINSAFNENYYYNAPFYPSPQPVFKFGVLWTFYN